MNDFWKKKPKLTFDRLIERIPSEIFGEISGGLYGVIFEEVFGKFSKKPQQKKKSELMF